MKTVVVLEERKAKKGEEDLAWGHPARGSETQGWGRMGVPGLRQQETVLVAISCRIRNLDCPSPGVPGVLEGPGRAVALDGLGPNTPLTRQDPGKPLPYRGLSFFTSKTGMMINRWIAVRQ